MKYLRFAIIFSITLLLISQVVTQATAQSLLPDSTLTSNGTIYSNGTYAWNKLTNGLDVYTDLGFIYTSVPTELQDGVVLQTANSDSQWASDDVLLDFKTEEEIMVYVIYSTVASDLETTWLTEEKGWMSTDLTVETDITGATTRKVKSQQVTFDQTLRLLGNGGKSTAASNYTVVLVPVVYPTEAPTAIPTPTLEPTAMPTPKVLPSNALVDGGLVNSGATYTWARLQNETAVYSDETITYNTPPESLQGEFVLQTANADANWPADQPLFDFRASEEMRVFVLYSETDSTVDTWLNREGSWIDAGYTVSTSDGERKVKYQTVSFDSRVTFKGNGGTTENAKNYTIVVSARLFPTPLPTPSPYPLGDTKFTSNGFVYSGGEYAWGNFTDTSETPVYEDEVFIYTEVPVELKGGLVLHTNNADKDWSTTEQLITFEAEEELRIYVITFGSDSEATDSWLNEEKGWRRTDLQVKTSMFEERSRGVYYTDASFDQRIRLMGNGGFGTDSANYTVVVTRAPGSDCGKLLQGDLDCSGHINVIDLSMLLEAFGSTNEDADLDDSGKVNAIDLTLLLANFGT